MNDSGCIISASRRTDIPAFYGEWFYQQVRQGFVDVPNPFSGKSYRVSLKPEDVSAVVFWSKEYRPFLPILEKIESIYQNRFLFHFTINGFQDHAKKYFEPFIPELTVSIQTAKTLAARYGADTLLWRFDPIIFSDISKPDECLNTFQFIVGQLEGLTSRCYISFVDLYGKVSRRFERLSWEHSFQFSKPAFDQQIEFAQKLVNIARECGIAVFTCCEDEIGQAAGILKGHCIDADLLQRLYPDRQFTDEIKPTRKGCGCYASRDIGAYNSCRHGCLYCYASL
ncbi:MAG TPA: hypothetical protein DHW42_03715 [Candidatus Marinimicrobia bacterium]|nr:hypothetical protein [Candidatus Neomarinimicrobiota bacterium]